MTIQEGIAIIGSSIAVLDHLAASTDKIRGNSALQVAWIFSKGGFSAVKNYEDQQGAGAPVASEGAPE